MAVLFAGGEFDAFEVLGNIGGGEFEFDTGTAAAFDSDYARGCLAIRKCLAMRCQFAAATEGWLHFSMYHNDLHGSNADNFLFRLIDTANNQSPFLFDGNSGTWDCERNTTGTTFVSFDTVTSSAPAGGGELESTTLHRIDFNWKIHATLGVYELFIDDVSVARFDGDTETQVGTTVDAIQFTAGHRTDTCRFSEIIVADESTIGWKLATLGPTADSATNNAWTNGETEVDDIGAPSDLTLMHSGTNGQIQGFVTENISAGASADGNDIKAVVVSARALVGSSVVQNIQGHVRIGSTDYFSASMGGKVSTHLRYVQHVFDQDPDATADWTESVVNAAEFGLRAVT